MQHGPDTPQELDPLADARVTEALNTLGTIEPPAGLVGQVMWRTRHQSVQHNSQRRAGRRQGEGLHMAKKMLIGLVGIAAAGLLVAYMSGTFPETAGTEGTIGAAQRYSAQQIRKDDVKLENAALASFLQTDLFDKLVHDKLAVAALASPAVQAALANPALVQALANPLFAQAMAAPAVQAALANPALAQALASPALHQELLNAQASGLGVAGLRAALADTQLAQALANQDFAQAMAAPGFTDVLANPALQAALANPSLAQALANQDFAAALASPGLQGALASPALAQILADSTAAQLLGAQLQSAQVALEASGVRTRE